MVAVKVVGSEFQNLVFFYGHFGFLRNDCPFLFYQAKAL
jgi:hypothetical protein